MDLSTTIIEEEMERFLSTAYGVLFQDYIWFACVMMFSCVMFPIFIVRLLNQYEGKYAAKKGKLPQAYFFRITSKLKVHYSLLSLILFFAAENVYHSIQASNNYQIYDKSIVLPSVILLFLAVTAVYLLNKFRSRGLLLAILFIILYSLNKQYLWWVKAQAIYQVSENLKTVVRYGSYAINHYLISQMEIMSVLTVVLVVAVVLYYYRRRYLFTPGRLSLPECEWCGKAISKGDIFCTCCGKRLKVNPIYQRVLSLDGERYCKICGSRVNEFGCVKCDGLEIALKYKKNNTKELKNKIIRGTLISAAFVLFVILPMVSARTENPVRGTADANNVFVKRWDEFFNNPDCAKDLIWLDNFDTEIEHLYQSDKKWYYVNLEKVQYNSLMAFVAYAEVTFEQMEVLERIKECVHDASLEKKINAENFHDRTRGLQNEFNQTIQYQVSAVGRDLPEDITEQLWHIVCNSINFYMADSGINMAIASMIVIMMNVCILIYLLNSFSLNMETGSECCIRKNRIKIEQKLTSLHIVTNVSNRRISCRIIDSLKGLFYCLIRITGEIWLFILQIFDLICIFGNLFRLQNIRRCLRWIERGLKEPQKSQEASVKHKEFWRMERRTNVIAMVLLAIMFLPSSVVVIIVLNSEMVSEEKYPEDILMVAVGYSLEISQSLLHIESSQTLLENDKENLCFLINKQTEKDQKMLNYSETDFKKDQGLYDGLCSLCKEEQLMLQEIKDLLENDIVPPREQILKYINLRSKKYLWVLEKSGQEFSIEVLESAYDL